MAHLNKKEMYNKSCQNYEREKTGDRRKNLIMVAGSLGIGRKYNARESKNRSSSPATDYSLIGALNNSNGSGTNVCSSVPARTSCMHVALEGTFASGRTDCLKMIPLLPRPPLLSRIISH